MAAELLGARTAQADRTDGLAAHRQGEAVEQAVDRAIGIKPLLAIIDTVVGDDGANLKQAGGSQRNPVLGDVRSILVAIELDLHSL